MFNVRQDIRRVLCILGLLAIAGTSNGDGAFAAACERPGRLRYSMVPEGDVERDLARFEPLLRNLGHTLGVPVDVVTPASYGAVIEGLLAGTVDVARLGPSSYVRARAADPGIAAFATFSQQRSAFQDEGPFYYAMLVVRAGKRFQSYGDLRGASLALVDPESTSGNKIPRSLFSRVIGLPLEKHFGRISYAGSHQLAAAALLEARTDAAFVSSLHLSYLVGLGKARQEDFRILWRSEPIPMDPFVYREQLCTDIKEKIRATFLGHGSGHSAVLGGMKGVRFLPVGDSDYDVVRQIGPGQAR